MATKGNAILWWTGQYESEGDNGHARAEAVFRAYDRADVNTRARQDWVIDSLCLYGDESSTFWLDRVGGVPLTDNVIASVTDSVVSDVTQSEPSPLVQCWGANYDEQQRAEELTQYLATVWEHQGATDLWEDAVRDAYVAGLGTIRAARVGDDAIFERIHPLMVVVDDRACVDTMPRELYLRRTLPKEHLQSLYPELEYQIDQARRPTVGDLWTGIPNTADVVCVVECWHLPSVPGKPDGRHTVAISNACLTDEPFDRPRYPLAFIRAIPPTRGFWGVSRVQRMSPLQEELNKQLRRQQDSMHLVSVPRVWIRSGMGPPEVHINDTIGAILQSPEAPVFMPPPTAIGPEGMQYVADLRQRHYAAGGSSELAATLQKPAGLDSGRSQRIFREWGTRLHRQFSRRAGKAAALACEDFLAIQREIAEEKKAVGTTHKIYYVAKDGTTPEHNWFDLDVDRDRMRVTVAAINALSRDPGERMGQCRDLVADNCIPPEQFVRLIGTADFDAIRGEIDAPEDLIRQQVGRMLSGGDYTPPEPYMNLQLCTLVGSRELQRAEVRGCPEDRLNNVRQWLLDTKTRLDESMAAEMPGQTTVTGPDASTVVGAPIAPPMTPGGGNGGGMPMPPPGAMPMPGPGGMQ